MTVDEWSARREATRRSLKARRVSIYMGHHFLREARAEAERLELSLSHVLQRAWKLARERVRAIQPEPPT